MGNVDQLKRISHSRHHIYRPTDLGTKAADRITGFVGSWPFVGIHAVWFIIWIALRPEPFPFGLLTLLVSLEAIFLSTFVMMSQNRQAEKDHLRDDHEAQEVDMLFQINQTQLEILQLLRQEICPLSGAKSTQAAMSNASQGADMPRAKQPVAVGAPRAAAGRSRSGPRHKR